LNGYGDDAVVIVFANMNSLRLRLVWRRRAHVAR